MRGPALLVAVALLCNLQNYVTGKDLARAKGDEGVDEYGGDIFLLPEYASSLLRTKRGFFKKITGEENNEEEESAERRREAQRARDHANFCRANCWGGWGGWSKCSVPCGSSGKQSRTRPRAPPSKCVAWVNKNGCPGHSSESRNCNHSCHNGGILRPNDCACKAGFRGQCCEQRVTCSSPGKPSNGNVSPAGTTHAFNTVATFTCNAGYNLKGPTSRTCLNSGQWSNGVPTCERVHCGRPTVPQHGSMSGSDFGYGATVVFSCGVGWNLQGTKTLSCLATAKWSAAAPTCSPVTCAVVVVPENGFGRAPNGRTYKKVAEFGCNEGFFMQGASRRTCQINSQWDGTQPTCTLITCPALSAPTQGAVTYDKQAGVDKPYGTTANFKCNKGYLLRGVAQRSCTGSGPTGQWTDDQPVCEAVKCDAPQVPEHGTRIGNSFVFPNSVSFQCLPGYFLVGVASIKCNHDSTWVGQPPTCTACPRNQFKSGTSAAKSCSVCPAHSHTQARASTKQQNCRCDTSYRGPDGGPCEEIFCPELKPPSNGRIVKCNRRTNGTCVFDCNPGHHRSQGDEKHTCRLSGTWVGKLPTCTACPKNTYKAGPTVCEACPDLTQTAGIGNEKTGCTCKPGYKGPGGGPCEDVDECKVQKGGCEQVCLNTIGSYRCKCNIAGYLMNMEDNHKCIEKNQCPVIDPPANGGIVCLSLTNSNTERCEVKCNPGYEHLIRTNAYEECGPSTNWLWSHEANQTPLLPCVETFYPDISLETEAAYFTESCEDLSPEELQALQEQFLSMLVENGICTAASSETCSADDVEVECGEFEESDFGFGFRRKRAASGKRKGLKFTFRIKIKQTTVAKQVQDCTRSCSHLVADFVSECVEKCLADRRKESEDKITLTKKKLTQIFDSSAGGNTDLKLGDEAIHSAGSRSRHRAMECPRGMIQVKGLCAPCPPGTHKPSLRSRQCWICPVNSFQPRSRQPYCYRCPRATPYSPEGATECSANKPTVPARDFSTTTPTAQ